MPQNEVPRALQSRALQTSDSLLQTRWLMFGQQAGNASQTPLLVVLVFWLAALFASFGLFAPRTATVVAVLGVSALSVSGAILLILEMNPALPAAGEGLQRSAALHPGASRPVAARGHPIVGKRRYAVVRVARHGETITLVAFPHVTLAVDDLLPPRDDSVD